MAHGVGLDQVGHVGLVQHADAGHHGVVGHAHAAHAVVARARHLARAPGAVAIRYAFYQLIKKFVKDIPRTIHTLLCISYCRWHLTILKD